MASEGKVSRAGASGVGAGGVPGRRSALLPGGSPEEAAGEAAPFSGPWTRRRPEPQRSRASAGNLARWRGSGGGKGWRSDRKGGMEKERWRKRKTERGVVQEEAKEKKEEEEEEK